MNRRGFLTSCLAASTAPAFVKADSLMSLWVPKPMWVRVRHSDGTAIISGVNKILWGEDGDRVETYDYMGLTRKTSDNELMWVFEDVLRAEGL